MRLRKIGGGCMTSESKKPRCKHQSSFNYCFIDNMKECVQEGCKEYEPKKNE